MLAKASQPIVKTRVSSSMQVKMKLYLEVIWARSDP